MSSSAGDTDRRGSTPAVTDERRGAKVLAHNGFDPTRSLMSPPTRFPALTVALAGSAAGFGWAEDPSRAPCGRPPNSSALTGPPPTRCSATSTGEDVVGPPTTASSPLPTSSASSSRNCAPTACRCGHGTITAGQPHRRGELTRAECSGIVDGVSTSLGEASTRIQATDPERRETPRVRTAPPGLRVEPKWLPVLISTWDRIRRVVPKL